jgi:hypothetical protein
MAARVRWTGLDAFRKALQTLPDTLTGEAGRIIEGSANAAAVSIRSAYGGHQRSGRLQDSVVVEARKPGRFGVRFTVRAKAKHAHLFEFGSVARYTKAGEFRGRMPARPTFVPLYRSRQRRMYDELKVLLTRHGLLVRGDA